MLGPKEGPAREGVPPRQASLSVGPQGETETEALPVRPVPLPAPIGIGSMRGPGANGTVRPRAPATGGYQPVSRIIPEPPQPDGIAPLRVLYTGFGTTHIVYDPALPIGRRTASRHNDLKSACDAARVRHAEITAARSKA
jgi:hypothetical protein